MYSPIYEKLYVIYIKHELIIDYIYYYRILFNCSKYWLKSAIKLCSTILYCFLQMPIQLYMMVIIYVYKGRLFLKDSSKTVRVKMD